MIIQQITNRGVGYSGPWFKVGAEMRLVGVVLGGHPYQEPGFLEKGTPT